MLRAKVMDCRQHRCQNPALADREATVTAMMEPRETAAPQAAKPDGQAPPAAAGPHPSFAVGRVADEMLAKAAPAIPRPACDSANASRRDRDAHH